VAGEEVGEEVEDNEEEVGSEEEEEGSDEEDESTVAEEEEEDENQSLGSVDLGCALSLFLLFSEIVQLTKIY
jgi:hypothetical protein